MKSISITDESHRWLKSVAAQGDEPICKVVERLVTEARKNKMQRRPKGWALCASCKSGVTSADAEARHCTNCGSELTVIAQ